MAINYVAEGRHCWKVFLDGKFVGLIRKLDVDCYVYQPKGSRMTGESFKTLAECKRSLEAA